MTASGTPATGSILVLTLHTGGHYYGEILTGVLTEAAAAGRHVVVAETRDPGGAHGDRSWGPSFDHPLAWDRVAGVVSIANSATPDYLAALREAGLPVVLASEVHDGFEGPVAMPDNGIAIQAAVQHLVDHGHRRIAFVGSLDHRDFRERHAAWQAAVAAHGLNGTDDLFVEAADFSEQSGAAAVPALLALDERPTAILTATDSNAIGVMRALTEAGVRIPDDIAVMGFDNIEDGAYARPSLSSIGQRFRDVGALAGRLLVDLMQGRPVAPGAYYPESLVMSRRASCGCRADLESLGTTTTRSVPVPDVVRSPVAGLVAALPARERDRMTDLVRRLDRLALTAHHPDEESLGSLIRELTSMVDGEDAMHGLAADLTEHVLHLVDGSGEDDVPLGHARVVAALWELQAYSHRHGERRLDRSAIELETIASALLRSDLEHIRSLDWLHHTHVRAGVLGVWDGPSTDGRLRIEGVHDPDGLSEHVPGDVVDVRDFPGARLTAASDTDSGEMCVVLPVASRDREWGLLTLLGRVETSSVREPYHHMTELLLWALEGQQLQRAVRASEERYAWASRASNDGLWEMDLVSRQIYLSPRCREITGIGDGDVTIERWTQRIHPDDRQGVIEALSGAAQRPGTPADVEYRLVSDDGAPRWVLSRGLGVPSADGRGSVRLVGSLADITTRRELEEQLRLAAMYDDVTGLANRRLFLDRLEEAMAASRRRPGARFAVVFLDLDGFKLINDSLGHLAGDDLLRTVAARLRGEIRAGDTAARFGGDEFAVLLADPVSDELLRVAERIQRRIARPVMLGDQEVSVTASVGIATSESGYDSAEDVLRDADTAMYQSKDTQRGTATIFDRRMHERAADRLRSRSEMRTALDEQQFVVHFQPIVPLDGSRLTSFEALVRWEHPTRGLLGPGLFLPAMEDGGTIVELGRWVTDEVCRQLAIWRAAGHDVQVSVNVSHLEFWAEDLVDALRATLARHDVPASALVLEITESVIMSDLERASQTMDDLRACGFRLHVDDFGTGHSSLQALRVFPVDTLKIDGSFIKDLAAGDRAAVLVRAIVAMAGGLGMDVVAECVETEAQSDVLRAMGCGHAQGWLYAKALPGDEAGALLGRRLADPEPAELADQLLAGSGTDLRV